MDLSQLLSGGVPGVAAFVIEVGKPTDIPTSALSPSGLRFEREFAKLRAAISERDVAIQMSRSAECDYMLALREKQDLWEDENPDIKPSEENPEYMAFVEPEYSAVEAAIRATHELKLESDEFLNAEHQRLRSLADSIIEEQEQRDAEPEPAEAPTGS